MPLLALALAAAAAYPRIVADIERERAALAEEWRASADKPAALAKARAALQAALTDRIFPAWTGTRWDFNGISRTPGEGAIACGRFVTTTLRDAGLRVDVRPLAQQLAAVILRTFGEKPRWSHAQSIDIFAAEARRLPEGLYGLGLDQHVGFLLVEKGEAYFIHSSWVPPRVVVREPVATSKAAAFSRSHVVAPILTDKTVEAWLRGSEIR